MTGGVCILYFQCRTVVFHYRVCILCGFFSSVTLFKQSSVNKQRHFRGNWRPLWLSTGENVQTPPSTTERSSAHPRVIT